MLCQLSYSRILGKNIMLPLSLLSSGFAAIPGPPPLPATPGLAGRHTSPPAHPGAGSRRCLSQSNTTANKCICSVSKNESDPASNCAVTPSRCNSRLTSSFSPSNKAITGRLGKCSRIQATKATQRGGNRRPSHITAAGRNTRNVSFTYVF